MVECRHPQIDNGSLLPQMILYGVASGLPRLPSERPGGHLLGWPEAITDVS
jgi:hypothetical protein